MRWRRSSRFTRLFNESLVEYYETKEDPIGKYFIERVKILSMTEKYMALQKGAQFIAKKSTWVNERF